MRNRILSDEEIEIHKIAIDKMDVITMARLRRFAKGGHIYFQEGNPLHLYFENRFQMLGGMTAQLSKFIGFDEPRN